MQPAGQGAFLTRHRWRASAAGAVETVGIELGVGVAVIAVGTAAAPDYATALAACAAATFVGAAEVAAGWGETKAPLAVQHAALPGGAAAARADQVVPVVVGSAAAIGDIAGTDPVVTVGFAGGEAEFAVGGKFFDGNLRSLVPCHSF